MSLYHVTAPLAATDVLRLHAGDIVRLDGVIYTLRDAGHARLLEMLVRGEAPPVPIGGLCIYYAGPCPSAPGEVLGPCGPTSSSRMDIYTPPLIEAGMTAMIGKGKRSAQVYAAMRGRCVYFAAPGGAGILMASHVRSCETIAFADLGTEALRRLTVEELPLIVAADAYGVSLYA